MSVSRSFYLGSKVARSAVYNGRQMLSARMLCDGSRHRYAAQPLPDDAGAQGRHAPSTDSPQPIEFVQSRQSVEPKQKPQARSGFLERILAPGPDGKNKLLEVLGYYSRESQAIAAGTSLYAQAVKTANAMVESLASSTAVGQRAPFATRYEILAVHVYLALQRLRQEKGSPVESDVTQVMQVLFDEFWTDLRNRMLIEEEGFKLIQSAKWVKECEQRFFGMAFAFDECFPAHTSQPADKSLLQNAISRNITCLKNDADKVKALNDYMLEQKRRQDITSMSQIWHEGLPWTTVDWFKPWKR